jgi:hypothetical protein
MVTLGLIAGAGLIGAGIDGSGTDNAGGGAGATCGEGALNCAMALDASVERTNRIRSRSAVM